MQVPRAAMHTVALFFDFDGTLVHLAPTPDGVEVSDTLRALLCSLNTATEGALAIVTGRSLDALDDLLRLKSVNVSGSHGAVYRIQGQQSNMDDQFLIPSELVEKCQQFAYEHQLIFENKQFSVTFHYRQSPDKEVIVDQWLRQLIPSYPALIVQRGKCVHEIKSENVHKGAAVDFFMRHPQFKGRVPWFFGDDTTDEYAFNTVNQLGGYSVKIGVGETSANLRLPSPDDLIHLLHEWLRLRS